MSVTLAHNYLTERGGAECVGCAEPADVAATFRLPVHFGQVSQVGPLVQVQ